MSREDQLASALQSCIPDIFLPRYTCLYIGASIDRFFLGEKLQGTKTIVEPWTPNVSHYRDNGYLVVADDIRNAVFYLRKFDIVMWWQGPEHLPHDDISWMRKRLESLAHRYIVFAYPHGESPQGEVGGNQYERHLSTPSREDFPRYEHTVVDLRDGLNPCAIAWRAL